MSEYLRMQRNLLVASVVVASVGARAGDANAVVICQRGSKVTLRADACKKKETPVALGAGSVPDSPDAGTVRGLAPLVARDSAGVLVGVVGAAFVSEGGLLFVVRTVNGQSVQIVLEREQVHPFPVLYEQSGCAGTPLLQDYAQTFLPIASVVGGMLYSPAGSAGTLTTNSRRYGVTDAADCTGTGYVFTPPDLCCRNYVAEGDYLLTTASPLALTPPFHIEGP
jgi:hypothetical protein